MYYFFSFFILCFPQLFTQPIVSKQDSSLVNEILKTLPTTGLLKQKENGSIYLDVSNHYIHNVASHLHTKGILREKPTGKHSIGAHISVFDAKEGIVPKELGQEFSFIPKGAKAFTIHTKKGIKKLWGISVHSKELENLRASYHLSPKYKKHGFHIAIANQVPGPGNVTTKKNHLSMLNFRKDRTLPLYQTGNFKKIDNPELLSIAQKIDSIGRLCIKKNGYVYLNVSNEFIDSIVPHLQTTHPFTQINTSKKKKIAAHISVFSESELIKNELWEIDEINQLFQFSVKEIRCIERKKAKRNLFLLAIDAPGIQRLRRKYGLSPKLKKHDFHITLGYEDLSIIGLPPCLENAM